jgi:tetratricopeptide (TPR) repeat protein
VQLLTTNDWTLINQGQARPLKQLLAHFADQPLSMVQQAEVDIARGRVYTVLDDNEPARECHQYALSRLAELSDSPSAQQLRAREYRGITETLEHESPHDALDWLSRGLEELAGANALEEAALLIRNGTTRIAIGDYSAALDAPERRPELLPDGRGHYRVSALGNLGLVYCALGDIERGKQYYHQVLEISEQLHDYRRMIGLWHNLRTEMETAGDWTGAAPPSMRRRSRRPSVWAACNGRQKWNWRWAF